MNEKDKEQPQYTLCQKTWPLLLFIIVGVLNVLLMKFSYVTEAQGLEKYGVHQFQKPWFIITSAFFGQSLMTIVYIILKSDKINKMPNNIKITELSFCQFLLFAVPAFADVFENIVSAITVAFIGPSIDSMLKSCTLIGVSIISCFFFKRYFYAYQWAGIILVLIAFILVSCAGIINATFSSTIKASPAIVATIVVVKIVSQFGYSVKVSFEEYFTQNRGYHPMMVSGLEGCWSTFICAFICLPIVQHIPSTEGNGLHEDTLDTFRMIKNSTVLTVFFVFMIVLGFCYSFISITLIQRTSALAQTLWKSFRTSIIWVIQFIIFYTFRKNKVLYPYRLAGEEWVKGSYLKLIGFIVLIIGLLIYNKIPKCPCFYYEPEQKKEKSDKSLDTSCENAKVANSPLIDDDEPPPQKN